MPSKSVRTRSTLGWTDLSLDNPGSLNETFGAVSVNTASWATNFRPPFSKIQSLMRRRCHENESRNTHCCGLSDTNRHDIYLVSDQEPWVTSQHSWSWGAAWGTEKLHQHILQSLECKVRINQSWRRIINQNMILLNLSRRHGICCHVAALRMFWSNNAHIKACKVTNPCKVYVRILYAWVYNSKKCIKSQLTNWLG